nr:hypothetical protein [Tanacetum cinerariifolium]
MHAMLNHLLPLHIGLPRVVKFDPLDHEIMWHLLAKSGARPPPGVSVAKQSEVNDEPVKIKLSSFIMVCMDILRTPTRFLFQDNFYQLAKRIQHENQRLLSNPYSLWSKRDVPSVGPTDYLSMPLIISQADNHQLVEGTAHPKVLYVMPQATLWHTSSCKWRFAKKMSRFLGL